MNIDFSSFHPYVRPEGEDLLVEDSRFLLKQEKTESEGRTVLRLSLTNRSTEAVRVREIGWTRTACPGDFFNMPPEKIAVYLEGWQMATPSGVRHFGDRDFQFNPEYIPFAVPAPADWSGLENHFRAEHMIAIRNAETEEIGLIGFITAADQYGRFRIGLGDNGLKNLDIVSSLDGRVLDPGETVLSEKVVFLSGLGDGQNEFLIYARLLAEEMRARKSSLPTGWCSWYYFFGKVTAKDVIQNAEFASAHRDTLPMRIIQVDAGYQSANGDWLIPNEKFPGGLEKLASDIRSNGFIPGVWFGPFMVDENSVFYREHPECVIHDVAGNPVPTRKESGNRNCFALDGTHPESLKFLRETFRKVRSLGIDYVKLDFLVYASIDGVLYDPKATHAQALRRGLEAIREGFGDDGFICCCTAPFGVCTGIADSMRTATDLLPSWYWTSGPVFSEAPTTPNVCRNVIHRTYMNRILWRNDPDTLIVRDNQTKFTKEECELWYQISRLAGGSVMLGDDLPTLVSERRAMSENLLRNPDAFDSYQTDLWECVEPGRIVGRNRETGKEETWLFNFDDTEKEICGSVLAPHSCCKKKENEK